MIECFPIRLRLFPDMGDSLFLSLSPCMRVPVCLMYVWISIIILPSLAKFHFLGSNSVLRSTKMSIDYFRCFRALTQQSDKMASTVAEFHEFREPPPAVLGWSTDDEDDADVALPAVLSYPRENTFAISAVSSVL